MFRLALMLFAGSILLAALAPAAGAQAPEDPEILQQLEAERNTVRQRMFDSLTPEQRHGAPSLEAILERSHPSVAPRPPAAPYVEPTPVPVRRLVVGGGWLEPESQVDGVPER